jgi:hypothetical protein
MVPMLEFGLECPEERRTLNHASAGLQGNEEAVQAEADPLERSRREAQQAEVQTNFTTCPKGHVAAPWPSLAFDETGTFLLMPWWRGIAVAHVASGKVRCMRPCALAPRTIRWRTIRWACIVPVGGEPSTSPTAVR